MLRQLVCQRASASNAVVLLWCNFVCDAWNNIIIWVVTLCHTVAMVSCEGAVLACGRVWCALTGFLYTLSRPTDRPISRAPPLRKTMNQAHSAQVNLPHSVILDDGPIVNEC